jgi:hypothetical protein
MFVKHLIVGIGTRILGQLPMICGVALLLNSVASTAHATVEVPEISADVLGSALAVLSGGVLLVTRRFSRTPK